MGEQMNRDDSIDVQWTDETEVNGEHNRCTAAGTAIQPRSQATAAASRFSSSRASCSRLVASSAASPASHLALQTTATLIEST